MTPAQKQEIKKQIAAMAQAHAKIDKIVQPQHQRRITTKTTNEYITTITDILIGDLYNEISEYEEIYRRVYWEEYIKHLNE
jgi:hypothetical protein